MTRHADDHIADPKDGSLDFLDGALPERPPQSAEARGVWHAWRNAIVDIRNQLSGLRSAQARLAALTEIGGGSRPVELSSFRTFAPDLQARIVAAAVREYMATPPKRGRPPKRLEAATGAQRVREHKQRVIKGMEHMALHYATALKNMTPEVRAVEIERSGEAVVAAIRACKVEFWFEDVPEIMALLPKKGA